MRKEKWVVLLPNIKGPRVAHRLRDWRTHCGIDTVPSDEYYYQKPRKLKSCRRCDERSEVRKRRGIE